MSRATLCFELPEEEHEFRTATRAAELAAAINDALQHIRARLKYGEVSDEVRQELEAIRDLLPGDL